MLKAGSVAAALSLSGCFGGDDSGETESPAGDGSGDGDQSEGGSADSKSRQDIARRFDVPFEVKNVAVVEPKANGVKRLTADVLDRSDGTIVYLAEGRYRLDDHLRAEDLSNVALVSEGAVVEPGKPAEATAGFLLTLIGENFSLEGITFDYAKKGFGGRIQCIASGDFVVRDVTVNGVNHGRGTFRFDVRDPNGKGLVENVVAMDGGQTLGMFVGLQHAGTITFRNCRVANFYNNGLYASAPAKDEGGGGAVRVEGGLYKNNNIAQIRLGGLGSYVRGTTVAVDGRVRPRRSDGTVNSRGIRFDEAGGVVVDDCDIVLEQGSGLGGIVYSNSAGSCTVKNTRIKVNADTYEAAINGRSPGDVITGSQFKNVKIRGSSGGLTGVRLVGRNGCHLRDVSVKLSGRTTTGLHLIRSHGTTVESCLFEVIGLPVRLEQAKAKMANVTKIQSTSTELSRLTRSYRRWVRQTFST